MGQGFQLQLRSLPGCFEMEVHGVSRLSDPGELCGGHGGSAGDGTGASTAPKVPRLQQHSLWRPRGTLLETAESFRAIARHCLLYACYSPCTLFIHLWGLVECMTKNTSSATTDIQVGSKGLIQNRFPLLKDFCFFFFPDSSECWFRP